MNSLYNRAILKKEMSIHKKTILIWIGVIIAYTVLFMAMYPLMKISMQSMIDEAPELYEGMTLQDLGMDNIISYFFAQIAPIMGVLSPIFVAVIVTSAISGEERDGTSEYIFSLPVGRDVILRTKLLGALLAMLLFDAAYVGSSLLMVIGMGYQTGFATSAIVGLVLYFVLMIVLQLIVLMLMAALCCSYGRKFGMGYALGLIVALYLILTIYQTIMGFVSNDLAQRLVGVLQYVTPLSFGDPMMLNSVFVNKSQPMLEFWLALIGGALWIGASVSLLVLGYRRYLTRDVA